MKGNMEDSPFGPGPSESEFWVPPWSPCPKCDSNKNVTPDYGSADFGIDGPMFCFVCEIEFPSQSKKCPHAEGKARTVTKEGL